MKTTRVRKFDLKVGSVITPRELSNVFQYQFMRYILGISYDTYTRTYVARGANDEGFDVKYNDELVYLGFGQWKKKENK